MYNVNELSRQIDDEEINFMESIFLKPNSISENITEAIIEMNIMREKTIPKEALDELIKKQEEYGKGNFID